MSDTIRDLRDVQFAQVETDLLRDPEISTNLKALYSLLITYGPDRIFPGQDKLAACLGVTRETVNRWLKQLKDLYLVTWSPSKDAPTNEYAILGYAFHWRKRQGNDDVIVESHPSAPVIVGSHPKEGDVIVGSQGVCAQDHRGCDPTITRSRSSYPDPANHMVSDPEETWSTCQAELQMQMTRPAYDTWIKPCCLTALDVEEGAATIEVPTVYAQEWLRDRFDGVVRRTLAGIAGVSFDDLSITYQVAGEDPEPDDPPPRPGTRITVNLSATPAGRARSRSRGPHKRAPPITVDVVPEQMSF